MQKKILASLLTVPMAVSAFAQIDVAVPVNKDAWTVNGLVGDYLKVDGETVETTGSVSAGWIKQTLVGLPAANYSLAFTEVANVTVTFTDAAGEETTLKFDGDNKSQKFVIKNAGDVVLTITPTVQSENFKFTGLNLDIDFDLTKFNDTLTGFLVSNFLTGTVFTEVDPDALAAKFEAVVKGKTYNAVALNAEKTELSNKVNIGGDAKPGTIREMIVKMRTIGDESTTFEQKVAIYNEYDLAAGLTDNKIQKAMDALLAEIKAHNANVKDLNTYWDNYTYNLEQKAESESVIAAYEKVLADYVAQRDAAVQNDTYGKYAAYIDAVTEAPEAAAKGVITTVEKQFTALFADMYTEKHPAITVEQSVLTDLAKFLKAFQAAEADVKAYCQWLNDTRDFLATYKTADTNIKALEGIMDGETSYKTNFATLQTAALEQIESLYNDAVDKFKLTEVTNITDLSDKNPIKGATVNGAADKVVMDDATAAINKVAGDLTDYVTEQNDDATSVLGLIGDATTNLNKITLPKVHEDAPDTHTCKQLAAKKAALEEQLKAIHDELIEAYVAAGKDTKDAITDAKVIELANKVTAIETEIAAFTELAAGISELLDTLNIMVGEVEKISKANEKIWGDLFYAKFKTAINNITEAICSIPLYQEDGKTPYVITQKEKDDISKACVDLGTNAQNLSKAWVAAYNAKTIYEDLQAQLMEITARKLFLDPSDKATTLAKIATEAEALQAECEKYASDYDAAELIENGQDCYEAMLALAAEFNKETVTNKYYTLEKTFDQDGSEANASYVAIKLAMLETYAEGEYNGKADVDALIATLQATLNNLNTDLDAENAKAIADYAHAPYNTIDNALNSIIDDPNDGLCIAKVETVVDRYKKCQELYDTFTPKVEALENQLLDDIKYIDENATPKADEFFKNEITKENGLWDQYQELANALQKAYDAYYDEEENMIAKFEDLTIDYATVMTAAQLLPARVKNNEAGNLALLNLSNNVRTAINMEIDRLTELMEYASTQGATDIAASIEGWIKDLNKLLINSEEPLDLASVDIKEKTAFNTGLVCNPAVNGYETNYAAIEALYKAVNDKFKEMQEAYNAQYASDLAAWNQSFLDTAWESYINSLNDAYTKAIQTFDLFMYGLKNPGYKAYIEETLNDHRDIYQYINKINDLVTAVQEYVADQTKLGNLITAADFATQATDKAEAMETEIKTKVETMETAVSNKAIEYNTQLHAEVVAYLNAEETKLEEAGNVADVEEETFAANYAKKEAAEELFTKYAAKVFDAADGTQTIGYQMDFVATDLDNALAAVDLEAAVEKQWSKFDIPAADTKLAAVDKTVAAAVDADEAVVEAQTALINEAKATIAELKTKTATTATDNKIEDDVVLLQTLQDALNDAVKKAEDAAAAIKANSDANAAEKAAFQKWDAQYAILAADLDALKKFIDAIAAGYQEDVQKALTVAEDALEAFQTAYTKRAADGGYRGALVANATNIQALQNKFTAAVAAAYAQAGYNENDLLVEWTGKLKAAYNDAKVNSGIENFDEEYATVKAFIDAIVIPDYHITATTAPAYQTAAVDLEAEIATYYNELQQLWKQDTNTPAGLNPDPKPLVDAKAKVAEAEDAAGLALTAAYEALQGYTNLKAVDEAAYNKFEQQYQEYLAEYEAIQAAANAEGARLILNWQKFVNEFNALTTAIGNTDTAAKAADDAAAAEAAKQAASDAQYDVLLGYYNDLEAAYKALQDKVEEYAITDTDVDKHMADIEADLEAALADLDAKKEAYALDANSSLQGEDAIRSAIDYTALLAAKAYANKAVAEATAANDELTDALKAQVVPEIAKALLAEQTTLKVELEEVVNAISAIDINGLDTTAAQYEDLHDQAAAIAARLKAMAEEAVENVYVLGDVNLDPDGVVNGADVQLLIQWVGEGKTYADLYAMSPVVAAAANVAQEPGADPVINIADVTAEINLAMNFDFDAVPARTFVQRKAAAQGNIAVAALGNGRYAINLSSTQAFVAGQFDILLPEGCEIVNAELAGMSHDLYQFNNDGYTRMIVASMNNEEIKGDQLLIIEVEGQGAPAIQDAVFTDANANAYSLQNSTVTGIDSIEAENGMAQRIYNAAGQAMRSIQRGINIIRHSDGTTTKELHK